MRCSWAFTKTSISIFVAKVKHGFVSRIRDEMFPALKRLIAQDCPFTICPQKRASRWGESLTAEKMNQCRWQLVCQLAFVEWTDAGHLRHCTFVAMRDDKKAAEVVRETKVLWFESSRVLQPNCLSPKI